MNKAQACISCTNSNCLIKKSLNKKQILEFETYKHSVQCKKGQHFILEGTPIHSLYFIQNGKVKVGKTGIQGKEQIIRFATNGEVIGHRGIGAEKQHQIHAVALEDSKICSFSMEILKEIMFTAPEFMYQLLLFFAEELHKSETKVKKFAQMTVREKVIDGILYLNRKFGIKNDYLNIVLSRRELADLAGTSEEQVIRFISALKKENLLKTKGKKIAITDIEKLKKEIADHNFFLAS